MFVGGLAGLIVLILSIILFKNCGGNQTPVQDIVCTDSLDTAESEIDSDYDEESLDVANEGGIDWESYFKKDINDEEFDKVIITTGGLSYPKTGSTGIGYFLASFFVHNIVPLNPSLMPLIRTKKPGRVVAITSVSGVIGNRGQSNYAASKAGVDGAIKSLAIELASRNITVNSIACGVIQTDMTSEINEDFIKFAVPAKRAGSVDEVSGVVEFLLSKDASYITRQVIGVNGGLC